MKKSSASFRRERRRGTNQKSMKTNTRNLARELKALMQLPESPIDTSDLPEVTNWSKAVVGKFYRPIKEPVTIRLDADIVAWLKADGPGYQTRINALLRRTVTSDLKDLRKSTRPGNPSRRQQTSASTHSRKRKRT